MNETRFQEFIRNVWLLLNLFYSVFIRFIVHAQNSGLEYVCDKLKSLVCSKCSIYFDLTIVVEPQEISILVLVLIEHFKVRCTLPHFRRDRACRLIVDRPVSCCKNFNAEFNSIDLRTTFVFSELLLQFFAQGHILEHLRHLIYLIQATLNFQLLKHDFLCFHGKQRLIEQSGWQMFHICLHESVTAMQATEKSNDCIESFFSFLIWDSLESRLQFLVRISSKIEWCLAALVHKVLEGGVTTLLKLHIIVETLL